MNILILTLLFASSEGPIVLVYLMAFEDILLWAYYSCMPVFVFAVYLWSWIFINVWFLDIHWIEHNMKKEGINDFLYYVLVLLFCWWTFLMFAVHKVLFYLFRFSESLKESWNSSKDCWCILLVYFPKRFSHLYSFISAVYIRLTILQLVWRMIL